MTSYVIQQWLSVSLVQIQAEFVVLSVKNQYLYKTRGADDVTNNASSDSN